MKAATIKDDEALEYISISIHAAREGGDFNPLNDVDYTEISIHAAREGGDFTSINVTRGVVHFNPRRP